MDIGDPKFFVPSAPSGGPWISVQPDIYRTRLFPQAHDFYLGSGPQKQLCCIRRFAEHGLHECLFIGSCGFVRRRISHELVVATTSDVPDHDPFLVLLKEEKPDSAWHRAVGPCLRDLKAHILGLEASLGPRRTLSIGVVCGLPNQHQQSEEEMFDTPSFNVAHLSFLSCLAEEIRAGSWNYFGQDFVASTKKGQGSFTAEFAKQKYETVRGYDSDYIDQRLEPDRFRPVPPGPPEDDDYGGGGSGGASNDDDDHDYGHDGDHDSGGAKAGGSSGYSGYGGGGSAKSSGVRSTSSPTQKPPQTRAPSQAKASAKPLPQTKKSPPAQKKLSTCQHCKGSGKQKCLCVDTKGPNPKHGPCKGTGLIGKCSFCNGKGQE